MPDSGGTFSRLFNWVNDANSAVPITASRFDSEMDGMADAFNNRILKDGTGTVGADIPWSNHKITGLAPGTALTDAASLTQVQNNTVAWVAAGGTADAITATYSPAVTAVANGMLLRVRAGAANATTTPTFSPNGLTARTITKFGGQALVAGDIFGASHELLLQYMSASTRWELLNPNLSVNGAKTNVANTFIANQTITGSGDTSLTITSTDAGAGASGSLILLRNSASPAASDKGGYIQWQFKDSNANLFGGVSLIGVLLDPTDTSEDTSLNCYTVTAGGAITERWVTAAGLYMSNSLTDPGAGKINATDYQISGTSITSGLTVGAGLSWTLTTSDPGASGPGLVFNHNTASPAVNDIPGAILVTGKDSVGNATDWAYQYLVIDDKTDGSEDCHWSWHTVIAGSVTERLRLGDGLYTPNATGGDKGADSINAKAVYDDNVLLCIPLEQARTGTFDPEEWRSKFGIDGEHPLVGKFDAAWLDPDEYETFWRKNSHLPMFPSKAEWKERGKTSLGEQNRAAQVNVECLAVQLAALNARLKALEAR